jgi:hypothetical protein
MPKTKTLFLLLPLFCNNEYLDARPNYALLEVDPGLVDRMISRIGRVRRYKKEEDPNIFQFESWDYSPDWIASLSGWDKEPHQDLLTGKNDALALVENGSPVLLDAKPPFDENDRDNRTECGTRLVCADCVKWQAIVKHTSSYVDTAQVDLGVWRSIRKVLQSGKPMKTCKSNRRSRTAGVSHGN